MVKLGNVRRRFHQCMRLGAPSSHVGVPPLAGRGSPDDSFVVVAVAMPPQDTVPEDAMLQLFVNDECTFAWPAADLMARYAAAGGWRAMVVELHRLLGSLVYGVDPLRHRGQPAPAEPSLFGITIAVAIVIPPRARLQLVLDPEPTIGAIVHLEGIRQTQLP